MTTFEDLDVWKRSSTLAVKIYSVSAVWKDYGLRDQITRSAVSIPSNIAEGAERETQKEFKLFLNYACGSAGELRTQLYIATKLGYITQPSSRDLIKEIKEISAMLHGLKRSLTKPKNGS